MEFLFKPAGVKATPELVEKFYYDNNGRMYAFDGKTTCLATPGNLPESDEYVLWCSNLIEEPPQIGNIKWLARRFHDIALQSDKDIAYIQTLLTDLSFAGQKAMLNTLALRGNGPFIWYDKGFQYSKKLLFEEGGLLFSSQPPPKKNIWWHPVVTPSRVAASTKHISQRVYIAEQAEFLNPTAATLDLFYKQSELGEGILRINCQLRKVSRSSNLFTVGLRDGDLIHKVETSDGAHYSPAPELVQGLISNLSNGNLKFGVYRMDDRLDSVDALTISYERQTSLSFQQRNFIHSFLARRNCALDVEKKEYITQLATLDDWTLLTQDGVDKSGWEKILT